MVLDYVRNRIIDCVTIVALADTLNRDKRLYMIKDRICQYCTHYQASEMDGLGICQYRSIWSTKYVAWCDTCASFERKVTIHPTTTNRYGNKQ